METRPHECAFTRWRSSRGEVYNTGLRRGGIVWTCRDLGACLSEAYGIDFILIKIFGTRNSSRHTYLHHPTLTTCYSI